MLASGISRMYGATAAEGPCCGRCPSGKNLEWSRSLSEWRCLAHRPPPLVERLNVLAAVAEDAAFRRGSRLCSSCQSFLCQGRHPRAATPSPSPLESRSEAASPGDSRPVLETGPTVDGPEPSRTRPAPEDPSLKPASCAECGSRKGRLLWSSKAAAFLCQKHAPKRSEPKRSRASESVEDEGLLLAG